MIYLLGGCMGFHNEVASSFKEHLKNDQSLVFVPTSPNDVEKTNKYAKITLEWFKDIGIQFKDSTVLNHIMGETTCQDHVLKADVVYLMGGNPMTQKRFIDQYNLKNMLDVNKQIIIGNSAGALNSCEKAVIVKGDEFPKSSLYEGMNLTGGINVDVHYQEHMDETLYEYIKTFELDELITLPEDEGILINDTLEILGKGIYKFTSTQKELL